METPVDPIPAADPFAAGPDTAYVKADPVKRFVALLIDGLLVGVGASILGMGGIRMYGLGLLLAAAYILVRDGLAFDFADGRSIGKKLMKLRPVRLDGGRMDLEASVRRNWTLALGTALSGLSYFIGGWGGFFLLTALAGLAGLLALVECVLVLTDTDGRRIGDKMAETQVVVVEE